MGSKKAMRLSVGMTQYGSRLSDHLFFRTGIPTRLSVDDFRPRQEAVQWRRHTAAQGPTRLTPRSLGPLMAREISAALAPLM